MAPFMQAGKTRFYFLPTIASGTKAPTVAEMGTGTWLTAVSATNKPVAIEGFNSETQFIEAETFADKQTLKVPGRQSSADSSIDFLEDDTSNPIRTLLARDTAGFIVAAPNGVITASSKVDVFPVVVGSNTRVYSAGNELSRFRVSFGITDIPAQDIAILA